MTVRWTVRAATGPPAGGWREATEGLCRTCFLHCKPMQKGKTVPVQPRPHGFAVPPPLAQGRALAGASSNNFSRGCRNPIRIPDYILPENRCFPRAVMKVYGNITKRCLRFFLIYELLPEIPRFFRGKLTKNVFRPAFPSAQIFPR